MLADFDGGSITSDAGALLLREADRRLGLIDRLDAVIPDPRNQSLVTHQQLTMLRQRIFAIALGYEGDPRAAGQTLSPAVARCEDHLPRRLWFLPVENAALV